MDDATVLAAAARAMAQHGPARLTLADVAVEAGLSPATLVQRFGSKRGLLLAVARAAAPDARRRFATLSRDDQPGPLEGLIGVLSGLVAGITREAMANHIAFLGIDVGDPDFRALAAAQGSDLRAGAAGLLAEAIEAGEMRSKTDAVALARAVHVTFSGSLIAWALDGEGPVEETVEADLRGLLAAHRAEVPAA